MTNIFIIHGAYGDPQENWFPWLKRELEGLECKVFVLEFPTPENQTLDNWLAIFKDYQQYLSEDAIVIGHSLGCAFLLNVIEKLNKPIKAAFLVAGWTGLLNDELDKINRTFIDREFDWNKIRLNCKKFYLINSDNDPYIALELGKKLAENLRAEFEVLENAGHINKKAGFERFDLLLEKIRIEM